MYNNADEFPNNWSVYNGSSRHYQKEIGGTTMSYERIH